MFPHLNFNCKDQKEKNRKMAAFSIISVYSPANPQAFPTTEPLNPGRGHGGLRSHPPPLPLQLSMAATRSEP